MQRIVIQIKKRIDKIDFRKLALGFKKTQFLLANDGFLYGIEETYPQLLCEINQEIVVRNNLSYAVVECNKEHLDYNYIIERLIIIMYKMGQKQENNRSNYLKFLFYAKDSQFYENKYKEMIIAASILAGNEQNITYYKYFRNQNIKSNVLYQIASELEKEAGNEFCIELKLKKMLDKKHYFKEISSIKNMIEDPTKIFDYLKYIKLYGGISSYCLDLNSKDNQMSYNFNYKLLLNFEKMMNDYQKHLKNLLMQKMLHAKRISLSGKIINLELNKIFEYNNIYYINGVLIYKEKLTLKKKKGEFILKLDNNQNIVEAYECLCIEKVLI